MCQLDNGPAREPSRLVAEVDGHVVGWLWARIEPPGPNAAAQLTREHAGPGWWWPP